MSPVSSRSGLERADHSARVGRRARPPGRRGARASSTSWVTSEHRTAAPHSMARSSHSCISARVIESSAPKGSSRSRMSLSAIRVRTKLTRWRMPAGELGRRRSSNLPSPKRWKRGLVPSRAWRRRHAPVLQGDRSIVEGVPPRQQAGRAGASGRNGPAGPWAPKWPRPPRPTRRPRSSNPATIWSSVDLPQPLGPRMATFSCWPMVTSTPRRATTAPKRFETPRHWMLGRPRPAFRRCPSRRGRQRGWACRVRRRPRGPLRVWAGQAHLGRLLLKAASAALLAVAPSHQAHSTGQLGPGTTPTVDRTSRSMRSTASRTCPSSTRVSRLASSTTSPATSTVCTECPVEP